MAQIKDVVFSSEYAILSYIRSTTTIVMKAILFLPVFCAITINSFSQVNDLALDSSTYGDFDFYAMEHPTGFEEMEYSKYPTPLAPLLKFSSICHNVGTAIQTDVLLKVRVRNAETSAVLLNSISAEAFNIMGASELELRAGTFQMPNENGIFEVTYDVQQDQVDENPDNTKDTLSFEINDYLYARDRGGMSSESLIWSGYTSRPCEIGNVFYIPESGFTFEGVDVGLSNSTLLPCAVYAKIYQIQFGKGITLSEVAVSQPMLVTNGMLNSFGEENFATIPLAVPVNLVGGKAYLVVVGSNDGIGVMRMGMSQFSEDFSAWTIFPEFQNATQEAFENNLVAMVRLNVDVLSSINELNTLATLSLFPSPGKDRVNLTTTERNIDELRIFSGEGRTIFSQKINSKSTSIDTRDLAAGVYIFAVLTDGQWTSQKWVKE